MKKKQTPPQLLSAYRNLSISAIYDLSDSEALIFLKNARWGNSHCFHFVFGSLKRQPVFSRSLNNLKQHKEQ